jgi:small-conductance mechanosensitive channel
MLLLSLLAAATVHFALRRAERRTVRALARRRGGPRAGPAGTPRALALGVVALQTLAWLASAWLATEQFAALRDARGEAISILARSLTAPLFALDERSYSARDLLLLPMLVIGAWIGATALTRLFRSQVLEVAGVESGAQEMLTTLLRYLLSLVGTIVVLQVWGVDLRSFAILASVLGVGIGFGLQNIANNFVSGVLINAERPVRAGDFVRIGEFVGTVIRVGGRSTALRNLDRVTILVPNSRLLESEVVNWSRGVQERAQYR